MASREKQILTRLEALGRPEALDKMAHFAIDTQNAFGVPLPELRRLAKEIGKDQALAQALGRA